MLKVIIDFEHGEIGTPFEVDLCIVGAGPAGLALAREFDGAPFRVLLLESGGLEPETSSDLLNVGESLGLPYIGLQGGRSRAFGGTSKLWAGQCARMDEIDFQLRSWVPYSGWPLTRADLDPFYERAEKFFEVAGQRCDERIWDMFGLKAPELDPDLLRVKGTVYGPYIDAGKYNLRTFKASKNIHVLLHATVTDIVTNESVSSVDCLSFRTIAGKLGIVRANAVVLCCGGIENARLLLLANSQMKAGLGNQYGMVGRFLQEHPAARTAVLEMTDSRHLQNLFGLFYKGGHRFFPKIALSEKEQRTRELLNGVAYPVYEYSADSGIDGLREIYQAFRQRKAPSNLSKKLRNVISNSDQTADTLYRRIVKGRSTFAVPQRIYLQLSLEQAPNSESRVSLSAERDSLGLPRTSVDWRLTELERRTAQCFTEMIKAELQRVGLAETHIADWLYHVGEEWSHKFNDVYHPAGTTRMSTSSKDGVVDNNCKVHDLSGLYLAGSSVFPTSGWANPTLTIVAFSLRLADHLKTRILA